MAGSYWNLLALSLALLLLLILISRLATRLASRRLRRLAAGERMRYSAVDRFHLAPRVAEWLGVGASDVRVRDLMYRIGAGDYVYVFTAEFAIGTIGGTRRRRIVAQTSEPVGRSLTLLSAVKLSDGTLPIGEQYRLMLSELIAQETAGEHRSPAVPQVG